MRALRRWAGLMAAAMIVAVPAQAGATPRSDGQAPDSVSARPRASWTIIKPTNTGMMGDYGYSVAVDAQDRTWVAADDPIWDEGGLARFDGNVWKSWTNVDGKAPIHDMGHIQFDAAGVPWMASSKGLLKLQGNKVKVVWSMANAPWPSNQVTDFDWGPDGDLWVALAEINTVKGGLAHYDGSTWTVYTTANGLPWTSPWDWVSAVEVDGQGRVWIGSGVSLGGAMFDGANWLWMPEGQVEDILITPQGQPWYGFLGGDVRAWNGTKWVTKESFGEFSGVSGLWLDRQNGIWATTYVGRVSRWTGNGFDETYDVPNLSHVYGLAFNAANEPWASGIGGLAHLEGGSWTAYNVENTGLPTRWFDDILVASTGHVWFSLPGGGVSDYDGTVWRDFNPYNWGSEPWPFLTDAAEDAVEGPDGSIWVALGPHGIGRWNGTSWTSYLPGVDVQAITKDASGAIWAAPVGGNVRRWTGTQWQEVQTPPLAERTSIAGDALGNIWVGTILGLLKWDGTSWTTYSTDNSDLPGDYVTAVQPEATGSVIWVGTDKGLGRFDGSTWTVYTKANSGLPADQVTAIAIAPDGRLWVGAFNGEHFPYFGGVATFDGSRWLTYTSENSPLEHEQIEALAVDALGRVWVGTASEGAALVSLG